jgi:glycosyltransferase involved in cell wall biosynthesis
MNPVRVLWVIKGLDRGGAERLVTLMAPRIDRDRYQIDVAFLLGAADAFVPQLQASGITTVSLQGRRTLDPSWPFRLRSLMLDGSYSLVHTHSPLPAAAARVLAPTGIRLVHTEHNMWGVYRWPTFVANAITYGRNDAVIAVSDGVAASVVRPRWAAAGQMPHLEVLLHGVSLETVPHGPGARARARDLLGIDGVVPVIGKVANLSPKKDHRGVFIALDMVRSSIPDVLLVLIGSGPLESQLRAEVRERGLQDHVRFLGPRDDVSELLPGFDVFVLGSRFEGLPIALLEAMAAEVAVVATRVGGIPEVISDGVDGRLVAASDPTALADTLLDVLRDHDQRARLAAAGRQTVATRFSIDRAVRRVETLYDSLLGRSEHGDE